MRKTVLKILVTILAVVAFFIAQYHIRKYYGIDPRIWFIIVYGISIVGLVAISIAFNSESERMKEYFKTHSFSEIMTKVKTIIEKIVKSFIYELLRFSAMIIAFAGILYKTFFYDDFMARTTLCIVFLVMIAYSGLSVLLDAMVTEKKRTKNLIITGLWGIIFLTNL